MAKLGSGQSQSQEPIEVIPPGANGHGRQLARAGKEASSLGYEMRRALRYEIECICRDYKITPSEALAKLLQMLEASEYERGHFDSDDMSLLPETWLGLDRLAANNPAAFERHWERIKQEARDDLGSGHLAARVTGGLPRDDSPQQRAQFLALREALTCDWQPRPGVEQMLIDTIAQAQTLFMYWMRQVASYADLVALGQRQDEQHEQNGYWQAPRVSYVEAMEQAAAMVDRFNRLLLRTLRQLRDLRRYAPQVTIQNAGQVNIASGQQTNLAMIEAPEQAVD